MEKVIVLLSSYNGEKFIAEQIKSILLQKEVETEIIIRDDGSTDKTVEVIETFQLKNNIELIKGENIGYAKSFMYLVKYAKNKAAYYAFCDQDDIWEDNKLKSAILKLKKEDALKPQLYFSNLLVTDATNTVIGEKKFNDRIFSFGSTLIRFNIPGCTMLFNNLLIKAVLKDDSFYKIDIAHDSWLFKVIWCINGVLVYDDNSYIRFRRHQNTASNLRGGIIKRLKSEWNRTIKQKNSISNLATIFLTTYYAELSPENTILLKEISQYKKSFVNRIKLVRNKELTTGILTIDCLTVIKIFAGIL